MTLNEFLSTSYTAYQAVANAAAMLNANGFEMLAEQSAWQLRPGGKYYVIRSGSSLIAFTYNNSDSYKIVASHTDSPCLKLKETAVIEGDFARLNVETYGGGILYTFFDRPLKIAGRIIKRRGAMLVMKNIVSNYKVVVPSLAIHMNREINDKFSPNPQTDLLPLLSLSKTELEKITDGALSYDLFAVCAEEPFESGINSEFLSSPRIDNLTSVYASLQAIMSETSGVCVAACLDSEEIGSQTRQGAAGDFLKSILTRIAGGQNKNTESLFRALSTSFCISLDNAHSLHPNHPEKCDLTNRAKMGGGIVIKGHAGGAYTTDALSSAVIKTIFDTANVKYQTFYNRSDMRSGSTLGAISIGQVSVPSVDLGIAQLAMHSAVETMCKTDLDELIKGLKAFYNSEIQITTRNATVASQR